MKFVNLIILLSIFAGCSDQTVAPPSKQPEQSPKPPPAEEPMRWIPFELTLDPRETPTVFEVSAQGVVRLKQAPRFLAGSLVRRPPRWGEVVLDRARCNTIGKTTADYAWLRNSGALEMTEMIYRHIRSKDTVIYDVILPALWRMDSSQKERIKDVARSALRNVGLDLVPLRVEIYFDVEQLHTRVSLGTDAWSRRMDDVDAPAGPRMEELALERLSLREIYEQEAYFSELDFLCDAQEGRTKVYSQAKSSAGAEYLVQWSFLEELSQ